MIKVRRHFVYDNLASRLACLANATAALSVVILLGMTSSSALAEGLECPTIDRGAVAALSAVDPQIQRMTTYNNADFAKQVGQLVATIKAGAPILSTDAIADILIATYCPVVARMPNASPSEKWQLMRRFARVVMQQITANTMPSDSSIIATVPLPPRVYQTLRNQAESSGQTPTTLMADILTRAAGQ